VRRSVLHGAGVLGLAASVAHAAPDPAQVELGAQLYLQMCRQCHGPELQSSGAGSFDLRQFPPDDPGRFEVWVMDGKNDGMPAHDDVLSSEDVDALFAYVVATQQAQGQRGKP
jgi:mono/diheme cytochrome c family protein